MNRIVCGLALTMIVITCSIGHSVALKVPGFIVLEISDTVFGEVQLNKYDNLTGGIVFDGINLNILYSSVTFKSSDESAYKTYYPCDIAGYGYTYQKKRYIFTSFTPENKNMFSKESGRCKFLLLVHRGKIDLYRDIEIVSNSVSGGNADAYYMYWYYLYNATYGLHKAIPDKKIRSVQDLLSVYGIEEEFISTIPRKSTFKDLKEILDKYEAWND